MFIFCMQYIYCWLFSITTHNFSVHCILDNLIIFLVVTLALISLTLKTGSFNTLKSNLFFSGKVKKVDLNLLNLFSFFPVKINTVPFGWLMLIPWLMLAQNKTQLFCLFFFHLFRCVQLWLWHFYTSTNVCFKHCSISVSDDGW